METKLTYDFGTFDEPEDSAPREFYRTLKLRQPNIKNGELKTEMIVKILPALPAYKKNFSFFRDKMTNEFAKVNWAFYHNMHHGYKSIDPAKPDEPNWHSFVCPRKVKDKVELVPCAQCARTWDAREKAKALREKYKDNEQALMADKDYQEVDEYLSAIWTDNKWKVLVMTQDFEVGVLKLSKTTFQEELYPLMMANKSGNFWVKFTTTGNNRNKTDKAEVYSTMQEIDLPAGNSSKKAQVQIPVECILTDEHYEKIMRLAPNISRPIGGAYLTQDQINRLTSNYNNPDVVGEIFDAAAANDGTEDSSSGSLKADLA